MSPRNQLARAIVGSLCPGDTYAALCHLSPAVARLIDQITGGPDCRDAAAQLDALTIYCGQEATELVHAIATTIDPAEPARVLRAMDTGRLKAILEAILHRASVPSEYAADMAAGEPPPVRVVIAIAAQVSGVPVAHITSKKRGRHIVAARHAAIWVVQLTSPNLSLAHIGLEFGGLDHTTPLHAIKQVGHEVRDHAGAKYKIVQDILRELATRLPAVVQVVA
jgi:hypothetical protein